MHTRELRRQEEIDRPCTSSRSSRRQTSASRSGRGPGYHLNRIHQLDLVIALAKLIDERLTTDLSAAALEAEPAARRQRFSCVCFGPLRDETLFECFETTLETRDIVRSASSSTSVEHRDVERPLMSRNRLDVPAHELAKDAFDGAMSNPPRRVGGCSKGRSAVTAHVCSAPEPRPEAGHVDCRPCDGCRAQAAGCESRMKIAAISASASRASSCITGV